MTGNSKKSRSFFYERLQSWTWTTCYCCFNQYLKPHRLIFRCSN